MPKSVSTRTRGRLKRNADRQTHTAHISDDPFHIPLDISALYSELLLAPTQYGRKDQRDVPASSRDVEPPSISLLPDTVVRLSIPPSTANIPIKSNGPWLGHGVAKSRAKVEESSTPITASTTDAKLVKPVKIDIQQPRTPTFAQSRRFPHAVQTVTSEAVINGSKIVHKFQNPSLQYAGLSLERAVLRYLTSISPLPTDLLALRNLSHELRRIISALTADKAPGVWRLRDSHFHNSIRALSRFHLEVLQSLKGSSSKFLRSRSLVKSFMPLITSLTLRPNLPSKVIPEDWRRLNLATVVETLMSCGIDLKPPQLALITKYTTRHDHISKDGLTPITKWIGQPGGIEQNLDEVSRIWKTRRRLLNFVRQEASLRAYDYDLSAEIITTSLTEATFLGVRNIAHHEEIRKQLTEWIRERDERFPSWTDQVNHSSEASHLTFCQWHGLASLLRIMLRHTVLAPRCRPQNTTASANGGHKPLSQGRLLQMLIQHTANDEMASFKTNGAYLHGAIFFLRNTYYRNYRFKDLVALVELLSENADSNPALDGRIYASLITATRDILQFKSMLVLLNRLKPPKSPVTFSRSILRRFCHFALLLDTRRRFGHLDAALTLRIDDKLIDVDSETANIIRRTGWRGLWRVTLDKWLFGLSPVQYLRLTKARERGRPGTAFVRNVEKRWKRALWFKMKKALNPDGRGYGGAILAERPAFKAETATQSSGHH